MSNRKGKLYKVPKFVLESAPVPVPVFRLWHPILVKGDDVHGCQ